MSAQTFNGVTVSGTGNRHIIVNHSAKAVIGYAIQGRPARIDLVFLATGKPLQPGEERSIVGFSSPVSKVGPSDTATAVEERAISYELRAVLFADGTFYGPDDILADFSKQIYTARSMAQDTQHLEDKYIALEQDEFMKAVRRLPATTDTQILVTRAEVARIILSIRKAKGESEAEAALARVAALPDVTRGEQ